MRMWDQRLSPEARPRLRYADYRTVTDLETPRYTPSDVCDHPVSARVTADYKHHVARCHDCGMCYSKWSEEWGYW